MGSLALFGESRVVENLIGWLADFEKRRALSDDNTRLHFDDLPLLHPSRRYLINGLLRRMKAVDRASFLLTFFGYWRYGVTSERAQMADLIGGGLVIGQPLVWLVSADRRHLRAWHEPPHPINTEHSNTHGVLFGIHGGLMRGYLNFLLNTPFRGERLIKLVANPPELIQEYQ